LPPVSAMPDHLHAIIAFPRELGMATTVKNWKKFVAGKHGVDWQRDFFDHRLRDHHELEEKTSYILMNPVRKGLCQRAEDWMWIYRPNDRPPRTWEGGQSSARRTVTNTARTHSTSLRASCDAPYLCRQTGDQFTQEAFDFLGIV
jgi:hypothetical protein